MNTLKVNISKIEQAGSLRLVTFSRADLKLTMLSLELSETLQVGTQVNIGVKATHIALSKSVQENSISNQLQATILSIEMGTLLCRVSLLLDGETWESVLTLEAAKEMQLVVGDTLFVLINASALSIIGAR